MILFIYAKVRFLLIIINTTFCSIAFADPLSLLRCRNYPSTYTDYECVNVSPVTSAYFYRWEEVERHSSIKECSEAKNAAQQAAGKTEFWSCERVDKLAANAESLCGLIGGPLSKKERAEAVSDCIAQSKCWLKPTLKVKEACLKSNK
jgi:hypothetical protein